MYNQMQCGTKSTSVLIFKIISVNHEKIIKKFTLKVNFCQKPLVFESVITGKVIKLGK